MDNNEVKFFYCYDTQMQAFLQRKGFKHVTKARHHKTGKLFMLYILDNQLRESIESWKLAKRIIN
ncbi:hypothetical protein [Priestia megaterium]|uniref:hypothetical protein n=1 Tax=Priestia megaterium TaxID=1404 RepID=UPI003CC68329